VKIDQQNFPVVRKKAIEEKKVVDKFKKQIFCV